MHVSGTVGGVLGGKLHAWEICEIGGCMGCEGGEEERV